MITIGVDPHKSTHTASALRELTHQPAGTLQTEATVAGYRTLLRWARQFEQR